MKMPKLSIFLKLILTVLVFGLLLNICVIIVFRLSSDDRPRKYLGDFMRRMEVSIVKDIGIPPDVNKAKQICEDLDIEMRFESPGFTWSSSDEMPELNQVLENPESRERFSRDNTIIARYNGQPYSLIRYPEGVFIIKPFDPGHFKPEKAIFLLIIFISIIIILLYFLLRRLFRPLKELSVAVDQIGDGNYNVKLPVERQDELGELADSINTMSEKIRNSIKAKQQLLIDVSHELRSPLTRMKLGLEVDSPKEKIVEDINEMEKMVGSLLENYRSDATLADLKPEKINVSELLEETIEEYSESHRIKFSKSSDDILINADPDKLQMVFRNLIDNALKYSSADVNVDISVKQGNVWISVKDSGIGISEEDLKYIFEPFYRADRSRSRKTGGFGLGLSICKKIIDAHKAEITVKSKVNDGTEIVLRFRSV